MSNYAVGGIEFDFLLGDNGNVEQQLNSIANGLKNVRSALASFSKIKIGNQLDKLKTNLEKLSSFNFSGLVNTFEAVGSATTSANISNITNSFQNLARGVSRIEKLNVASFTNSVRELGKMDFSNVVLSFQTLENLNPKSLTAFSGVIRNIQKISNLDTDFQKVEQWFYKLADAVEPFLQRLREVQGAIVGFSNALNLVDIDKKLVSVQGKLNAIKNKTGSDSSILGKAFNIGKLYLLFNYSKRIGSAIGSVISASIDFTETLNKFQVSFGNLTDEATSFVNQLTNAFNLSSESVMNYMSTFNNMLKSLGGIDSATALTLSKTLTQMAIDYASLMNTSIDKAMQQFQSVLAGQTKAIRTTSGIDVTDNTIMQIYEALGGTKTQRQLSQTEKRLLRILAVEMQLSELGAMGYDEETGEFTSDFQKTLNSTANNLKRISETFKELSIYLGNILSRVFEPIIEKTLTFVIVLKEVIKSFAILNGYVTKEYANNISSMFANANEEAEDLEDTINGLLSFDKFEVLNTKSQSDAESIEMITKAFQKYKTDFSKIQNNANELAKKWLEILGYQQEITIETNEYDEEIEIVNYKLKDGLTLIEGIKETALVLIGLGIAKLLKVVGSVISGLIVKLGVVQGILNAIIKVGLIAGLTLLIQGIIEGNKVLTIVGTTLTGIFGTLMMFKAFNSVALIKKIIVEVGLFNASLTTLQATLIGVGGALVGISIASVVFANMDGWSKKTKTLVGVLGTLIATLTTAAVAWMTYHGAMSVGVAVPVILGAVATGAASITALIKGLNQVEKYASGGFPTKGQMFIANESGAELVGNIGGRTAVANNDMIVQAIEQASYKGIVRGMQVSKNNQNINLEVSGLNSDELARAIFKPLLKEFSRNGINILKA